MINVELSWQIYEKYNRCTIKKNESSSELRACGCNGIMNKKIQLDPTETYNDTVHCCENMKPTYDKDTYFCYQYEHIWLRSIMILFLYDMLLSTKRHDCTTMNYSTYYVDRTCYYHCSMTAMRCISWILQTICRYDELLSSQSIIILSGNAIFSGLKL